MVDILMDNKIPVTVVTGFLGSGKTTLVNHVLHGSHGKRIAVIENEFGEVGIDDALVLQSQEEIFEMNNGCICCTVRGDLIRILHKLIKRRNKFDFILIETTGMADPAPVVQTFFVDDGIKEACTLDAVLTVVDARHVVQHLDEERKEGIENETVEQIAFADRVLLNKIDLVSPEEVASIKARIKGINGFADIIEAQYSQVDLDRILGINAFSLEKVLKNEPDFLEDKEHQHDDTVSSVGIEVPGSCNTAKLNKWLGQLLQEKGADLFRSKGVLAVHGTDDRYVFQGVHMLLKMGSSAEGMGRPWGPDEKRINKLVFIGRNLDREALTEGFRACVAEEF